MRKPQPIPVTEIVNALEREAGEAAADPRRLAANYLRQMNGWENRTLMCCMDERPLVTNMAQGVDCYECEDGTPHRHR
jgi:hypothetical protein